MRRLMFATICGLLLLASAAPVAADWGHLYSSHLYGRSYFSYGHHHHGHYVHRYHHRHYVLRYYSYPSFSFSYRYTPTPYYVYRPSYYGYPYCASLTSSYYGTSYSPYALSLGRPSPIAISRSTTRRSAFDASGLAKLAEGLLREIAAARRVPPDRPTRSLGTAPSTTPRARAMSLVKMGDEYFRAEQYQYAHAYYEAATRADADSAEACFRQGLSAIATRRHDEAVSAFKQGLARDSSFLSSTFRLEQIYKDDNASTQHVEALAATALENGDDPHAFFLIGAFLHFEGTPKRAEKFLQRASDLSGDDNTHVVQFLAASRRSQPLRLTSDLSSDDRVGPF
ncbi:MAG: hypothetical protein CMJ64_13480 [Planctomycetaceae bacterium]|nr:hypothetical protein [Planctomycetaceae bacterium]